MPKQFVVAILWGTTPEEGQEADVFRFDTKVELDAFMQGVEAASGWLDHKIVEPGYVHAG